MRHWALALAAALAAFHVLPSWTVGLAAASADLRLVDAVEKQDKAAVRALLKQRVDVNTPQADGATPLAWAAHWDDLETANLLIRAGADVNAANDHGVTALALACPNGNVAMVEMLLKAGADPNAAQSTGETAIMTAARTGNVDIVKTLLAHRADVNAQTASGQTALMWAVAGQHADVARELIERGADVHARSAGGFTPLLFAARQGALDAAHVLLAAGANVNEASPDGSTPLLVASASNHEALAVYLLENGANPNAATTGYTALHVAAQKSQRELAQALLAHGANPNARLENVVFLVFGPETDGVGAWIDLRGATPFLLAARGVDVGLMRLLVEGGADPVLTTTGKTTPLMMAAGCGQIEGLRVRRGASAGVFFNRTTWEEFNALEAVKLILQLGADVNAADEAGNTGLHGAAYMGANSIVQFLVEKGASLDARDKQGQTPFRVAEGHKGGASFFERQGTAELLRKLGANTSLGVDGHTLVRISGVK